MQKSIEGNGFNLKNNTLVNKKSSKIVAALIIAAVLSLTLGFLFAFYNQKQTKQISKEIPSGPNPTALPIDNRIPTWQKPEYVPGQILVKAKPDVTKEQLTKALEKYNAKIINTIEQLNRYTIEVPKGQEIFIMNQLFTENLIEKAERDQILRVFMSPNDELYKLQWFLKNNGQTVAGQKGKADIHIEKAWDTTQGEGIKVAILDTGIDQNHPDLSGKVIEQKVFIGGSIEDNLGHGTHVAGIISANTNNKTGVAGVCPKCKLIIAKTQDDKGEGTIDTNIKGLTWVADQGAKVINMSLGAPQTSGAMEEAVNYAIKKGAVVVAATGNTNTTQKFYPAAYDNVVSVAATDNNDKKASFSNTGEWVKLAAPGVGIVATLPTHPFNLQQQKPGLKTNYDSLDGTSMAAPIVSGVAALLIAVGGTSPDIVAKKLYDTAEKIDGTGTYWTKGRVDAAKAVGAGQPNFNCISQAGKCDPNLDAGKQKDKSGSDSGKQKGNCDASKYASDIQKNALKKNFGDPNCDFDKNDLFKRLKRLDPDNANKWFNSIIPCESSYNPNAYHGFDGLSPDQAGAWGLYQMGRGKNGPSDHGDVEWKQQTDNAVNYNKGLGGSFAYWGCAR